MTATPKENSIEFDNLFEELCLMDVDFMCNKLFGITYETLGKLIYPHPKYKNFQIKKRDGSFRFLSEPRHPLKKIQKNYSTTYIKQVVP